MYIFILLLVSTVTICAMDNHQEPGVMVMGQAVTPQGPSPEAYAIRNRELKKVCVRCASGTTAFGCTVTPVFLINWSAITASVTATALLSMWGLTGYLTGAIMCTGAFDRLHNICRREWYNMDRLRSELDRMETAEREFLVEKIFIPCDRVIDRVVS